MAQCVSQRETWSFVWTCDKYTTAVSNVWELVTGLLNTGTAAYLRMMNNFEQTTWKQGFIRLFQMKLLPWPIHQWWLPAPGWFSADPESTCPADLSFGLGLWFWSGQIHTGPEKKACVTFYEASKSWGLPRVTHFVPHVYLIMSKEQPGCLAHSIIPPESFVFWFLFLSGTCLLVAFRGYIQVPSQEQMRHTRGDIPSGMLSHNVQMFLKTWISVWFLLLGLVSLFVNVVAFCEHSCRSLFGPPQPA